jgi:predicted PhzF superfamily epimerase YddE/YHI9
MKDYVEAVADDTLSKIVLLAKKEMLSFYIDCGFSVTRPSPISHGKETWYELELDLARQRRDRDGCPCYVVDAFASDSADCAGNPAAVVVLDDDDDDDDRHSDRERDAVWMQRVAMEFNLSETAFLVRRPTMCDNELAYTIRYFTPTTEVPLCGHATLASAAVIFDTVFVRSRTETTIVFTTIDNVELRANLSVSLAPTPASNPSQPKKRSYRITMEFPSMPAVPIVEDRTWVEQMLQASLNVTPDAVLFAGLSGTGDVLVELPQESFLSIPHHGLNLDAVRSCDKYARGVIVCCRNRPPETSSTGGAGGGGSICSSSGSIASADDEIRPAPAAKSATADFLSRFFGPKAGIDEDPVTGSAHCVLAPYFAEKLDKDRTVGMQTSSRGGIVECCLVENQSVQLTGTSIITMTGTLWL